MSKRTLNRSKALVVFMIENAHIARAETSFNGALSKTLTSFTSRLLVCANEGCLLKAYRGIWA